jgi:cellulose synthase/poly-beta-1,6-N-acetylglucosamine synthase-like glycosyltransferase
MPDPITDIIAAGYQFYLAWSSPVHEVSIYLYNTLFFPMLFFSSLFYIMAFSGVLSSPRALRRPRISRWPRVTVQIPTLNEIVALRCAKKCLDFDYPKNRYEIIIGDDSSDPKISRAISDFARKYPGRVKVTRRRVRQGFKAGNLNHMLKHSSGEIIVTFDSDFIPSRDFLKKTVPHFVRDRKIGCLQTKWKCINRDQNLVTKFASAMLMLYHNLLASINSRAGVSLLFGSGQAVRRELLIKLGGWQEGSLTEDVEFSLRTLKSGYGILYLSDFTVLGEVPFTAKGFFKQQKKWAYGNARAFLDHWRWILSGKDLNPVQRSSLTFTLVGYIASPFIVSFMLMGILSFMTGEPANIDVARFISSTGWTMAVNSGFMLALVVALLKEREVRMTLHVLAGSVTVGLYTAFGVTSGFFRAMAGRKVDWYMIRKAGNESVQKPLRPSAPS